MQGREHYRPVFETHFIPILAGERAQIELPDHALPPPYRAWKQRIFKALHFLEVPVSAQQFENVMKELGDAIINRAYQIIESVPA